MILSGLIAIQIETAINNNQLICGLDSEIGYFVLANLIGLIGDDSSYREEHPV